MKFRKLIVLSCATILMGGFATESAFAGSIVYRCQAHNEEQCNKPVRYDKGSGTKYEYYSGDRLIKYSRWL
ncbi:periplasmic component [Paenibacillus popilliae ATCC 14706]|uniref:Periplasmic component n=1 Tax=Paenibacillus popilliae ATCC 14706 TaxID=1212764 RepID=M9M200_PAEPP|nr:periplasmic component [Paenibacillus popilliae ATCC 14706]